MTLNKLALFLISMALVWAQYQPPSGGGSGTVTSVTAGNCLSGGAITATGTIALSVSALNAQTTTYQVVAGDFTACKTISVASGSFTITLVASGSQPAAGTFIDVLNYGSGVVTIARSGQNINGGTASVILPAASATFPTSAHVISDASNYFINTNSPARSRQIVLAVGPADIATTGTKSCTTITTGGTLSAAYFIADALPTGANLSVDVLRVAFASYTGIASATSITGANYPIIQTGDTNPRYSDTSLTSWTKTIAANDVVCIAVQSAPSGGATWATLTLILQ